MQAPYEYAHVSLGGRVTKGNQRQTDDQHDSQDKKGKCLGWSDATLTSDLEKVYRENSWDSNGADEG